MTYKWLHDIYSWWYFYESLKEVKNRFKILRDAFIGPLSNVMEAYGVSMITDDFFLNVFLIMKLSKPPSFRVIRAQIASQSTFEI